MPVLSVIPFILHLMIPVDLPSDLPPRLQEQITQGNFFSIILTPNKLDSIDSSLTFTDKLGGRGKLPSPLFAQLERSMSNNAIIYHQYHDKASDTIKKAYLYSENCAGKILLTEDAQKATTFKIRNEKDELHGSNFHISCLRKNIPSSSKATQGSAGEAGVAASTDQQTSSSQWLKLEFTSGAGSQREIVVTEDLNSSGNASNSSLIGVISPYYMQQFQLS